ncbi:MAG: DNA-binding response regulator, partial [Sphingobacteriales bacterium]
MLKAIIIDDEEDAIASLKILLDEFCEEVEVAGTAANIM